MRPAKRTSSCTTSTEVCSPVTPATSTGSRQRKSGEASAISSSVVNCAPSPARQSWKPISRTLASVRSVDAVLRAQLVGVDLEDHVLRHQRLVERVELAERDHGGVGQLGRRRTRRRAGRRRRGRRPPRPSPRARRRRRQAAEVERRATSSRTSGRRSGRVEGPAQAAAVADRATRVEVDDRLEERLELALVDAVRRASSRAHRS